MTATAWAIWHWRCGLYPDSVRRTRRLAIKSFQEQYGLTAKVWAGYNRSGEFQAVPVRLVIAVPATPQRRREVARLGGIERAKQMTPDRRREIARRAALARWDAAT